MALTCRLIFIKIKLWEGVAVIKTKITSLVIGLILGAGLGLYGNIDDA